MPNLLVGYIGTANYRRGDANEDASEEKDGSEYK